MNIVFFGNNRVGLETLRYLSTCEQDKVLAVVLHSESQRKYGEELVELAQQLNADIIPADKAHDEKTIESWREQGAEIGVSAFYGHIIKEPLLSCFPEGIVNIHPSYLPYNRGAHPNVWSLIEKTPAGATLHYIDAGVDTGDIIHQVEVPVTPIDTGETLYTKLEQACVDLFRSSWPEVRERCAPRIPQPAEGTLHKTKDLASTSQIDLNKTYRAEDLINLLRARTFPPYEGCFLEVDGQKYFLQLDITPEKES